MVQSVLSKMEPELLWKATVYGRPVSKSNRQLLWIDYSKLAGYFGTIVRSNGAKEMANHLRGILKINRTKSKEAHQYEADFILQTRVRRPLKPLDEDMKIVCRIWYKSRRSDVDESLILDSLQKAEIIKNDNLIRVKEIYGNVDPNNPRAEIELWSLGIF